VEPCIFGGDPDCTQCGCAISSGLHWLKEIPLAGPLRVKHIALSSATIGSAMGKLRRNYRAHPRWSKPAELIQIAGSQPEKSRLSNKVAIVTGASKGIGGGIATALGAAGARVAVNYSSDREGAERVAQAITDNGGESIAVGADVSKAADVARLFKEVDSAFGRLDVLVNNAGVFRFGAFAEITEESFHLHYDINVLGAILTVQQAIKRFGAD